MGELDRAFTVAIPEAYDRYMVPMLFAPYARVVADLVAAADPPRHDHLRSILFDKLTPRALANCVRRSTRGRASTRSGSSHRARSTRAPTSASSTR